MVSSALPEIKDQIFLWRTSKGLSQMELERKAGLAHNTLSRIETGQVQPRLETLEKLARILETDVEGLQFKKPTVSPMTRDTLMKLFIRDIEELPLEQQADVVDVLRKIVQLTKQQ